MSFSCPLCSVMSVGDGSAVRGNISSKLASVIRSFSSILNTSIASTERSYSSSIWSFPIVCRPNSVSAARSLIPALYSTLNSESNSAKRRHATLPVLSGRFSILFKDSWPVVRVKRVFLQVWA